MADEKDAREQDINLKEGEREEVAEREQTSARVLHEVVRRHGDEELERPTASLIWSGLAGGVAISASVFGQATIEDALPDAKWAPLVSSLGYTLGFLVAILGRLQLFTESTLSAVIPVATHFSGRAMARLGRYWALVLVANLVGTFLIALLVAKGLLFSPDQQSAMLDLSRKLLERDAAECLRAGIPAGFLIAAIPWALPISRGQEFWVVAFLTYFVGLGAFTHVVAGSCEAWLLALTGEASWGRAFAIMGPTLIGNVIGGTGLFALLAHAQVRAEI